MAKSTVIVNRARAILTLVMSTQLCLFIGIAIIFTGCSFNNKKIDSEYYYPVEQNKKIVKNDPDSKLFYAVLSNDLSGIKDAVKAGANVNSRNVNGGTPLFDAVAYRDTKIVSYLVSKGASVQIRNKYGSTPLHVCAGKHNRKTIINILLSHGADINAKNIQGETPIYKSISGNQLQTAKQLVKNGAHIDVKDNNGKTPLMDALDIENEEFAEFFIKNGANTKIVDNENRNALDIAIDNHMYNIIRLLRCEKEDGGAVEKVR